MLANYRYILRHLRSLPSGPASSGTSLRANVVAEFRRGAAERDDKQAMALREAAHCYVDMVSSVKELTRLRELDSGEKLNPRDKVRATAGRVGLSVPKVRPCLLGPLCCTVFHVSFFPQNLHSLRMNLRPK